jgi:hypothetical protein
MIHAKGLAKMTLGILVHFFAYRFFTNIAVISHILNLELRKI